MSAHWEGSGSKRGKRESYLDSRLKDMSRICLGLRWPNYSLSLGLLGKNLGSGKPPIILSCKIFQEGIIAGLKSGIKDVVIDAYLRH